MNDSDKHYNLYVLAESNYLKQHEKELLNIESLFPNDWYSITDYMLKNKILFEAISQNKYIEDTDKYKEYIQDETKIRDK